MLVAVLALVIPLISPRVFAASSVTLSGGDSVKGGDTFTVAVTFGGGNIGRVDASLTYDTDKLTYISGGSSTGNSGYIQLSSGGTDGSVTFNIEFQAISEGDTVLEVTTREMYDLNEAYIGETPSASKTISIAGNAASEDVITQTTSPDQPVAETELAGVDEKPEDEGGESVTLLLVAAIAIPLVLIIIIAVLLARKKKKKNVPAAEGEYDGYSDAETSHGSERNFETEESTEDDGYSGRRPVERDVRYDRYDSQQKEDDEEIHRPMGRAERKKNGRKSGKEVRKKASEETESWSDWEGFDDNDLR